MLKMYRGLPTGFQVRHLFATGVVDDVLTANTYASAEEFKACVTVNPSVPTLGLVLEKELTRTEQKTLGYEPKHMAHSDTSEYMMRSTWPRITFTDESIPVTDTRGSE